MRTERRQFDLVNNKLIKDDQLIRVLGEETRCQWDKELIISTVMEEITLKNSFQIFG